MQLERLDNAIRRFGEADPRVIPYRYTLARYYEQSRLPESARAQYEEVLKAQDEPRRRNRCQPARYAARARRFGSARVARHRPRATRPTRIAGRAECERQRDRARLVVGAARRLGTVVGEADGRARLLSAGLDHAADRFRQRRRILFQQTDDGRFRPAALPRRPQRTVAAVYLGRDRARVRRLCRRSAVGRARRDARCRDVGAASAATRGACARPTSGRA